MNILHFDSEESWVQGVASFWCDRLRTQPRLRICLPSGHTPNKVYAAMTRAVAGGQASFRQAEIFSLDEFGGLAPDDAGLCSNMLRRFLIDAVDLPKERFHTLDPNAPNVDQVCREYDAAIGAGFDLTLLGIGLNGHLGLNEPGSAVDSPTRRVEMHSTTVRASAGYLTHSRLPTWGVAVGLKPLLASREIWLLANGSAKAEIIQRALKGPIDISIPASLLRQHPNSYAFLDAAAGALLEN